MARPIVPPSTPPTQPRPGTPSPTNPAGPNRPVPTRPSRFHSLLLRIAEAGWAATDVLTLRRWWA